VQEIEAHQGVVSDLVATDEKVFLQRADIDFLCNAERVRQLLRRGGNVGTDSDCPVGQLIPRQQVSGKTQGQGQHQQGQADQPVKLPAALVGAGVKHPRHVQEHADDHQMCGPAVHVSHQPAGRHDVDDILHGIVSVLGARFIINHEQ